MDWSAVSANLDEWRTYLNAGIVIDDFDADGLEYQNFYRPSISGFPTQAFNGQLQQTWWRNLRNREIGANASGRTEIFVIAPSSVGRDEIVRTDLGARIYLPGSRRVQISCFVEWHVYDYQSGLTDAYDIGRLGLMTYTLATDTETFREDSAVALIGSVTSGYIGHAEIAWEGSLAQGKHDVYLGYDLDGGDTGLEQVTLFSSNMTIEAYWAEQ